MSPLYEASFYVSCKITTGRNKKERTVVLRCPTLCNGAMKSPAEMRIIMTVDSCLLSELNRFLIVSPQFF